LLGRQPKSHGFGWLHATNYAPEPPYLSSITVSWYHDTNLPGGIP
jgi:hypothetical protein